MLLWKRLPAEFQRRNVAVTPRSYRRYWTHSLGVIHRDLFAAAIRWVVPGAVVWDVGANLGMFSFAAAARTGTSGYVYAFEADIGTAAIMTRSLSPRVTSEAEICICPWAVGANGGEARFVVSGYRSAASALTGHGRFGANPRDQHRTVALRSIDEMARCFKPPSLLKIDVEGAENMVLEGAEKTVQDLRPVILIEASGGETGARTAEILRSWGYVWRGWNDEGPWQSAITELGGDFVAIPYAS